MKKINLYEVFLLSVILYAIAIFCQSIIPSSIQATKIIGVINIVSLIFIYTKKFKKRDIFVILFIFAIDTLAIINNGDFSKTFEHIAGITSTLLIINKLGQKEFREKLNVAIDKMEKFIFLVLKIIALIVLASLFMPSCYQIVLGDKIYVAFTDGAHTACSALCLFLSLYSIPLAKANKNIFNYIFLIPFVIAILQTGARSYLLIALTIFLVLYESDIKRYKLKYVIIFFAIIALAKFFMSSNAFNKFITTSSNEYVSSNKLEAVTSGRIIWWNIDIKDYMDNYNFIEKIFGRGYDYIYRLNLQKYGLEIWAHDDYIQLLLSVGLLGLSGYIAILLKFFKDITKRLKNNSNKHILGILFSLAIVFIILWQALMNGFYVSQGYVFAVMLIILEIEKSLEKVGNKKENVKDD